MSTETIRFIRDGEKVGKAEFRSCVKVEVAVLGFQF